MNFKLDWFIYFSLLILINSFIFFNIKKLSSIFNIIDAPDFKRRIHKKKTPKIGGLLIFFVILFFYLVTFLFNKFYFNFYIIIPLFMIFFVGILDDKFDLKANLKLFLLTFLFVLFLFLNKDFIIKELLFTSIQLKFYLKLFSIPVSIICFLLLINSINMLDGINGLCSIVQIIILILLITLTFQEYKFFLDYYKAHQDIINFNIIYLTTLLFFLSKNLRGEIFLGDAGSYFGSIVLIINIVYFYHNSSSLRCDQIFLLLIFPGVDMLRVFIIRIYNKKNPFNADNNHFHHLLLKKFKATTINVIASMLIIIPNLISIFHNNLTMESLLLFLFGYFTFLKIATVK